MSGNSPAPSVAQLKWETSHAAAFGAAAGAIYGVMQIATGPGPVEPDLIYYLGLVGGFALLGAVMFAIVAALRNRLMR